MNRQPFAMIRIRAEGGVSMPWVRVRSGDGRVRAWSDAAEELDAGGAAPRLVLRAREGSVQPEVSIATRATTGGAGAPAVAQRPEADLQGGRLALAVSPEPDPPIISTPSEDEADIDVSFVPRPYRAALHALRGRPLPATPCGGAAHLPITPDRKPAHGRLVPAPTGCGCGRLADPSTVKEH